MKRILLLSMLFCCMVLTAFSQRSVTGRVTDASNGEGLIGATITLKGAKSGTTTDVNGDFKLAISTDADVLMIAYTGYETQEVTVGNRSTIEVSLNANNILNEVVVVGYGKQIKSTLTGNIAKVGGENLQSMPVVSFEQALQGQAAGVFVESTNGKVGAANRIRVRGVGSINAGTEPLYVVDGIPLSKDARNTAGGAMNPLSDLNFNDIASIEVLKDASAKAIYGSRGSNGVVLITTKSGSSGKSKIELDVQFGVSQPTGRREFLNAAEFVDYFTEAANNSDDLEGVAYDDPNSWTAFVTSEEDGRFRRYSGFNNSWKEKVDRTDWQEEALRNGSIRNTTLSFSGGNDKIRYYASGYTGNIEGIIVANGMQKNGGRVNLDFNATSRLKMGVNLNVARTFTDQVTNDNAFSTPMQLVALAPITPTRDEFGEYYDRPVTTYYNGLLETEESQRRVSTLRTLGTVFGDYSFTPNLALRVEGSANLYNVNDAAFFGDRSEEGNDSNGAAYAAAAFATDYNTNAVLRYNREFGKHDLGLNLGTEFFSSENTRQYAFGEQFPTDDFRTLASAASITDATSTVSEYTFLSYFGRAQYNFARKYLFNVSGRVDGSSRFGKDNRYAFFPAASAGWVLSEEEFLKGGPISFLKLRASWGQSGNADIGNFAALGLYSAGNYNGSSTLQPEQIPNPALTWEKSTESDFGVDFGLFNNRISGEVDYYVKNTSDLLLNVPVPGTSGFSTQTQNIGEIQNKGWELTLNTNNIVGDFTWSTSLNFALNKNKVVALADGQELIDDGGSRYLNVVKVGAPIGVFYGAEYAGVDPQNGDALWYVNAADDNGVILDPNATTNDFSEANFVELGSPLPNIIGGISNTFAYKGLSLDVRLQGQTGNNIHNAAGGFMSCNGCWFDNQTRDQLNSWKNPGDITNVPEARLGYSNGDQSRSSRFIEDGSYLRVKNVTLAYNLPTTLLKKARISNVRLYVTGTNLFTFTRYTGWDPEVTTDFLASNVVYGVDFYAAPQPKTIVGGVRFTF